MASTIGSKLATMERDCQGMVSALNNAGQYRPASQVQSLLQQVGQVRAAMEQERDGDSPPADQEYPSKA